MLYFLTHLRETSRTFRIIIRHILPSHSRTRESRITSGDEDRDKKEKSGNKRQKKLQAPLEKWRRTNRAAFLVVKSTRGRLSDANCHLLFHANAAWVARYTQGIDTRVNEERRAGLTAIALANYS